MPRPAARRRRDGLKWWQDDRHLPQQQAHFFLTLERWQHQLASAEKQNGDSALRRLYAQENTRWRRKRKSYAITAPPKTVLPKIDELRDSTREDVDGTRREKDVRLPTIASAAGPLRLREQTSVESLSVSEARDTPRCVPGAGRRQPTLGDVLGAAGTSSTDDAASPPGLLVGTRVGNAPCAAATRAKGGSGLRVISEDSVLNTVTSQQARLAKALNAKASEWNNVSGASRHNRDREIHRGCTIGAHHNAAEDDGGGPVRFLLLPQTYKPDWSDDASPSLVDESTYERQYTVPVTSPVEWGPGSSRHSDGTHAFRIATSGDRFPGSPPGHPGDQQPNQAQSFVVASCLVYRARREAARKRNYFPCEEQRRPNRAPVAVPTQKEAETPSVDEDSRLHELQRSVGAFRRSNAERVVDSVEVVYGRLEAERDRNRFGAAEVGRVQASMKELNDACEHRLDNA